MDCTGVTGLPTEGAELSLCSCTPMQDTPTVGALCRRQRLERHGQAVGLCQRSLPLTVMNLGQILKLSKPGLLFCRMGTPVMPHRAEVGREVLGA